MHFVAHAVFCLQWDILGNGASAFLLASHPCHGLRVGVYTGPPCHIATVWPVVWESDEWALRSQASLYAMEHE